MKKLCIILSGIILLLTSCQADDDHQNSSYRYVTYYFGAYLGGIENSNLQAVLTYVLEDGTETSQTIDMPSTIAVKFSKRHAKNYTMKGYLQIKSPSSTPYDGSLSYSGMIFYDDELVSSTRVRNNHISVNDNIELKEATSFFVKQ